MTDRFEDADLTTTFDHRQGDGVGDDDQPCQHRQRRDRRQHHDQVIEHAVDNRVEVGQADDLREGNVVRDRCFDSRYLWQIDLQ